MDRYTVSLDEKLAAWVEAQAEQRGVSRAKVIRDAVALARQSDVELVQSGEILDRLEELEGRVQRLEADAEPPANAGLPTEGVSGSLRARVAESLTGLSVQSATAQAAIMTVWDRLREVETAETAALREYTYQQHGDAYASAESLWQSIQRYLTDVPGIEKAGHGKWQYAGDETVEEALSE